MKNKFINILIIILVCIVSVSAGFAIGRYITIRRNARYFSRFVSYHMIKPEIDKFRKEMAPLMEEKIRKDELLFIAIAKGDSDFAFRISEEIIQLELEMREKVIRHILETSKDMPPDMRKAFIRGILMRDLRKPINFKP